MDERIEVTGIIGALLALVVKVDHASLFGGTATRSAAISGCRRVLRNELGKAGGCLARHAAHLARGWTQGNLDLPRIAGERTAQG